MPTMMIDQGKLAKHLTDETTRLTRIRDHALNHMLDISSQLGEAVKYTKETQNKLDEHLRFVSCMETLMKDDEND